MNDYAKCEAVDPGGVERDSESAVMASFLRLEKSQTELRVVLDRLVGRLAPVMRPNMTDEASLIASDPRERQSQVVEMIQEAITRTRRATEMVEAATDALEV